MSPFFAASFVNQNSRSLRILMRFNSIENALVAALFGVPSFRCALRQTSDGQANTALPYPWTLYRPAGYRNIRFPTLT
jgi:hypothetical protein